MRWFEYAFALDSQPVVRKGGEDEDVAVLIRAVWLRLLEAERLSVLLRGREKFIQKLGEFRFESLFHLLIII